MLDQQKDSISPVRNLLSRIQKIEPQALVRKQELGTSQAFEEAPELAERIIFLFNKVKIEFLDRIPDEYLDRVYESSSIFLDIIDEITSFDPSSDENSYTRNELTDLLRRNYFKFFNDLHEIISFITSISIDEKSYVSEKESEINKIISSVKNDIVIINDAKEESLNILENIKKSSAESGLNQQANYFRSEAIYHSRISIFWGFLVFILSILLASLSISYVHYYESISLITEDPYAAIQIIVSKVIIFAIITYLLILSVRNFLAHRHNIVINRHRQNALLTYNALVDATSSSSANDIVLSYAASCIFAPQETGYSKHDSASSEGTPPIHLLSQIIRSSSN